MSRGFVMKKEYKETFDSLFLLFVGGFLTGIFFIVGMGKVEEYLDSKKQEEAHRLRCAIRREVKPEYLKVPFYFCEVDR